MNKKQAVFFLLLVAGTPAPGLAGEEAGAPASCLDGLTLQPVTLSQALRQAYESRADLQYAREELAVSQAEVLGARAGFLPTLNASVSAERYVSYSRNGQPVAVGNSIVGGAGSRYSNYPSLGLNWSLFNGGKDRAAYRGAAAERSAAEANVVAQTRTTLTDVVARYAELLKAQVAHARQREVMAIQAGMLRRAEQRYQQGRDSLLTIEQGRLALEQEHRNYLDRCRQLSDQSEAFAQAIGLAPGLDVQLWAEGGLPASPALPATPGDMEAVIDADPQVTVAESRTRAAVERLRQARGAFLPSVSLFGRYDWLGSSTDDFDGAASDTGRNSYRVGVVLQQPIGPFISERAGFAAAQAEVRKQQAGLRDVVNEQKSRVRQARDGKRRAALAVALARESARHAEEILRLTEQLHGAGRASMDTLDQARLAFERERDLLVERELEDRLQEWTLYGLVRPQEFIRDLSALGAGVP
jgi:outer membrane protein TolC